MSKAEKPLSPRKAEHRIQVEVVNRAKELEAEYPELRMLYAVPNGARVSIGTAVGLKAEGLKSGVPDLVLPVARGGYNALYIEMKTPTGKISDNQNKWHGDLRVYGNYVTVCRSADETIDILIKYLTYKIEASLYNTATEMMILRGYRK
jgi:hypothetical protein